MSEQKITFILNKLVRSKIPDDMREMGQVIEEKNLEDDAKLKAMIEKIREEAAELGVDGESLINELADLKQIVDDTIAASGHADEVEKRRQGDYERRGGFIDATYIGKVTLSADDPWVEYYRKSPDRYPELENKN